MQWFASRFLKMLSFILFPLFENVEFYLILGFDTSTILGQLS
jgi:hypothetical protein